MRATIRDVAARAGVSVATASRALSSERGVRPENRERVLAAAAALDYQPNILAAALRGRTTYTVGMVVPSIGNPYFATLVEAEDAAGYGYEVRAAQSEGDVRTAAVARAAEHRARAQGWALAAGTDGTPQDPRRVAYALPDGTDAAALARQVESGLAQTYASLVAAAAPTSRD